MDTDSNFGMTDGDRMRGRATGAIFFTAFGAAWMFLGLAAVHLASLAAVLMIAAVTAVLLVICVMLLRRARQRPAGDPNSERARRAARMFSAVNIIQWVSVATAVAIFLLLHMPEYIAPAIAIIVGLHLFPLADAFRNQLHYLTGTLLVVWPLGCLAMLPRARVAGPAAIGTGVILLASAAWSLTRILRDPRTRIAG